MTCDECASPTITLIALGNRLLCSNCFSSETRSAQTTAGAGEWQKHFDKMPKDRDKVESDGLSTSYYSLPAHAKELRHLISYKGMSKSRGDIFKACYRLGEKAGTDVMYDLNKMKFFIEDLIEMHKRGEHL